MKFDFMVSDGFFSHPFTGVMEAESKEEAIELIKDDYACELGTTQDQIEILEINLIV
jgi:ribosomal protein L20A (L18A)